MALIKETISGYKFLKKIPTQADYGAIASSHLYSSQLGSDGTNNRTFTLPRDYAVGSDTLIVFVNNLKAVKTSTPQTNLQYSEVSSKTILFGAPLNDTDTVEFYVAGTWIAGSLPSSGEGSGTLNSVYVNDTYTMSVLDRALVDSRVKAINITLPLNPIQGDVCEILDAGGNANVNNITVGRNGKPIQGVPDNLIIDTKGVRVFFVYIDDSYGWKFTLSANEISQATGFRQYHFTYALENQTIFTLPFDVNLQTKNVSIHIDGVKQIQDLAYTVSGINSITFSEALLGGEKVEFESFNASSLGNLEFKRLVFEGVAVSNQASISLPWAYTANNIAVYKNNLRIYPSSITEIDSTTIGLSSAMSAGDKFLVETVQISFL